MRRRKRKVTLTLPDEFLDLCEFDSAEPERVLRGFIADVSNIWSDRPRADGYNSNGSDQSSLALDYYLSVDHRRLYRFMREHEEVKNQLKSPGSQAADLNCRARQKDLTADSFPRIVELSLDQYQQCFAAELPFSRLMGPVLAIARTTDFQQLARTHSAE